jgi:hypothetical protein
MTEDTAEAGCFKACVPVHASLPPLDTCHTRSCWSSPQLSKWQWHQVTRVTAPACACSTQHVCAQLLSKSHIRIEQSSEALISMLLRRLQDVRQSTSGYVRIRQETSVSQQPAIAGSGCYETYVSILRMRKSVHSNLPWQAAAGSSVRAITAPPCPVSRRMHRHAPGAHTQMLVSLEPLQSCGAPVREHKYIYSSLVGDPRGCGSVQTCRGSCGSVRAPIPTLRLV